MLVFRLLLLLSLCSCSYIFEPTEEEYEGKTIKMVGRTFSAYSDKISRRESTDEAIYYFNENGVLFSQGFSTNYYSNVYLSKDSLDYIEVMYGSPFDTLELNNPLEYYKPTFNEIVRKAVLELNHNTVYIERGYVQQLRKSLSDDYDVYPDYDYDFIQLEEAEPYIHLIPMYEIYSDSGYQVFIDDELYREVKISNDKIIDNFKTSKYSNIMESNGTTYQSTLYFNSLHFPQYMNGVNPKVEFDWDDDNQMAQVYTDHNMKSEDDIEPFVLLTDSVTFTLKKLQKDTIKYIFSDSLYLQSVYVFKDGAYKQAWGREYQGDVLVSEYSCSVDIFYGIVPENVSLLKREFIYENQRLSYINCSVNDSFLGEMRYYYEYW